MEECYFQFTKSNTRPLVFLKFLKLHKWYKIAQSINSRYFGPPARLYSVNTTIYP